MMILVLLLLSSVRFVCAITICNNFWAYSWSFMSSECYNDPIDEKNISEVIRSWGFNAEEHYLTTEDGYKILVERAYGNITKETPIVMVHGMMLNALIYVAQGEKSLTKLLVEQGYDVWLLNYRGTKYSQGHVNLTTDSKEYWKYTIDDLGIHDIRTTLRYVNDITKERPTYIGFSMGTTGFFVYATSFPEESQKLLKGMIALAPVTDWRNTRSPMRYLSPIWARIKSMIVYKVYNGETHSGMRATCKPLFIFTPGIYLVQFIIYLFFGDGSGLDPMSLPRTIEAFDSTGAETATHYFQMYEAETFQKYDYGKDKNLEIYGTEQPPAYDMSKVPVPVAMFLGGSDVISTKTNCEQIYEGIKPSVRCGYHEIKSWGHFKFFMASDVIESLYLDVLDKIEDIELGNCKP